MLIAVCLRDYIMQCFVTLVLGDGKTFLFDSIIVC